MDKIEQIIHKVGLPATFTDEFYKHSSVLHLKKNDFFVKEKMVCNYLGLIESGALYAFIHKNEDEIVNDILTPNSFITYYRSYLTQLPSNGNIKAIEDSRIYVFTYSQYQNLLKSHDWALFFKYVSDTLFIKKCARENAFMKLTAIDRFKQLKTVQPNVEQLFPQYIIASYLGIKPETLSRIKSLDLRQEK